MRLGSHCRTHLCLLLQAGSLCLSLPCHLRIPLCLLLCHHAGCLGMQAGSMSHLRLDSKSSRHLLLLLLLLMLLLLLLLLLLLVMLLLSHSNGVMCGYLLHSCCVLCCSLV